MEALNEIDDPNPGTRRDRAWGWITTPANITRGWLLFSTSVGFIFVGFAIYAAIQTAELDNRVTRERIEAAVAQQLVTCEATNARRAEAKVIALADVMADEQIWQAIDDAFDNGLPEPVRTIVFDGFESRRAQIDTTYTATDCIASHLNPEA